MNGTDKIRSSNIYLKEISNEDNRKNGKEAISKEIEVEKFPDLINDVHPWIPKI